MKPVVTLLLLAITTTSFAQDSTWHTLRKFRLDIKIGGGDISQKDPDNASVQSYGFLVGIEPGLNINDYVSAGLHYNFYQAYNGHNKEVATRYNNLVMPGITLCLPGVHTDKFMWQVGASAGANFYTNKVDTAFFPAKNGQAKYSATGFAFMPHGGFQYGRVTFDAAYLVSGNNGNNYFCASLGFYLGGGQKK